MEMESGGHSSNSGRHPLMDANKWGGKMWDETIWQPFISLVPATTPIPHSEQHLSPHLRARQQPVRVPHHGLQVLAHHSHPLPHFGAVPRGPV